jgi:hypothetical protein
VFSDRAASVRRDRTRRAGIRRCHEGGGMQSRPSLLCAIKVGGRQVFIEREVTVWPGASGTTRMSENRIGASKRHIVLVGLPPA